MKASRDILEDMGGLPAPLYRSEIPFDADINRRELDSFYETMKDVNHQPCVVCSSNVDKYKSFVTGLTIFWFNDVSRRVKVRLIYWIHHRSCESQMQSKISRYEQEIYDTWQKISSQQARLKTQNQSNAKKIRSYCDILDESRRLYGTVQSAVVFRRNKSKPHSTWATSCWTRFKVAVQDRTSKLGGIMSYVNNLAEGDHEETNLYTGFTLAEFAANEDLTEVQAKDRIQRLLVSGTVIQPTKGMYRLTLPGEVANEPGSTAS